MAIKSVSARTYENRNENFRNNKNFSCSFGAKEKIQTQDKHDEDKSSKFGFKTATNVLGVAAWIGIVGYSIKDLKLIHRKSPEILLEKTKSLKKQVLSYSEKAGAPDAGKLIDSALEGTSCKAIRKSLYGIGNWFQNAKMKTGGELFNNYLYALGTLVVMPAVVMFSPFGKKDSSKEDKLFAVLRQPISVASTLGMQFTFDKLIGKYLPEVMKKNQLEDKSILDEKGKIKFVDDKGNFINKNFESIKYNSDSAKEIFKELFNIDKTQGGLKGFLTNDDVGKIFTNRSFEEDSSGTFKDRLKGILNDKFKGKGLNISSIDDIIQNKESFELFKKSHAEDAKGLTSVAKALKQVATVLDNNKMALQKSKTWVNVIAASIIGCTFLNVIYGKTMKALKNTISTPPKPSETKDKTKNESKEVK